MLGLNAALKQAIAGVRKGALVVVDVYVAPEYARATSSALMRQAPGQI